MSNSAGRGWPLQTWWTGNLIGLHTKRFSAFYHHDGVWDYTERVLYPPERITLSQYLYAILSAFGIGRRKAEGMKILLIAHISRAEWHLLKDRKAIRSYPKKTSLTRDYPRFH